MAVAGACFAGPDIHFALAGASFAVSDKGFVVSGKDFAVSGGDFAPSRTDLALLDVGVAPACGGALTLARGPGMS